MEYIVNKKKYEGICQRMGTDEIFNLGVSLNLKTTLLNYTKQGTNQVYDDDY